MKIINLEHIKFYLIKIREESMIKLGRLKEILIKDSRIKICLMLLEEVWVAWEIFSQYFKIYLAFKGKIQKDKTIDKRL